jgi:hypothetical protein
MAGSPTVGARVITADRQSLGTVKEVDGDCFKVSVPLQPDYWFSASTIASTPGNEVRMIFIKDNLAGQIDEGPNHRGFHPH